MRNRSKNLLPEAEKKVFQEEQAVSQLSEIDYEARDYANPPVPDGYVHICGEWNDGFVIERLSDRSRFVWVPVGSLQANGTLDGNLFNNRFGRRNFLNTICVRKSGKIYQRNKFSERGYHEQFNPELALQLENYGFYFSCYLISKNKHTNRPQSVSGEMPWTGLECDNAIEIAATVEDRDDIISHLVFGAEYDSVLEWLVESKIKTCEEIEKDSTYWGNYWNSKNALRSIAKTGSCEEWCVNNIWDLAGNVQEWTQELDLYGRYVERGGAFFDQGGYHPVASRSNYVQDYYSIGRRTGFRVVLYVKKH